MLGRRHAPKSERSGKIRQPLKCWFHFVVPVPDEVQFIRRVKSPAGALHNFVKPTGSDSVAPTGMDRAYVSEAYGIRLPPGSMAAESHCMSRRVVAPAVSRGKPK